MASVDPYTSCPCGSGQKYKWCCQKVEAYAERAQRMIDSGQFESSLKPLEEGLARNPGNAWLLTRKALVEAHLKKTDEARATLESLLRSSPGHLGAMVLLIRLLLGTEGPEEAVAQFQRGLGATPEDRRQSLASIAQLLGTSLARAEFPIAAMKHLELAARLGGEDLERNLAQSIASLKVDPQTTAWEKSPYRLRPVPDGASEAFRKSFEQAMGWAEEGLWSSAASAFELLSAGSAAGAIADYNRGLCSLWVADNDAAIAALRRFVARTRPTPEAVDLEALCQLLEGSRRGPTVEFVHLTWPVRDREALIKALESSRYLERGPGRPIDRDDEESPPADEFFLLDRPKIEPRPGLTRQDIPIIEGEVLVGPDSVVLETYDDSRLDRLIDRFTVAAGTAIPPAHPRTKLIEKVSRYLLTLTWQWSLPHGLSNDDATRLEREQRAHVLAEVWPETPNPALGGRSPSQAAKSGDAETALRGALRLMEASEPSDELLDWAKVRERLGVAPEPAIDPRTLDLDKLHLSRWTLIPAAELDDAKLVELYRRAGEWGLHEVRTKAGRVLVDRPESVRSSVDPLDLFGTLALDAARRRERGEVDDWIARGRKAETERPNRRNLEWELIEFQASTLLDGPQVWVPTLVSLLDRCRTNQDATAAVLYRLVRLGLVRPVVDPDRPGEVMLDMGLLDHLITEFGPRIAAPTGERAGAGIWTPEVERGGAAIWTPGAEPAARSDRPGLILPGQ